MHHASSRGSRSSRRGIAARNVRKNLRHSVGSALAVAAGFVAIALFQGYLSFIYDDWMGQILSRFMIGEVLVERTGLAAALPARRAVCAPIPDALTHV